MQCLHELPWLVFKRVVSFGAERLPSSKSIEAHTEQRFRSLLSGVSSQDIPQTAAVAASNLSDENALKKDVGEVLEVVVPHEIGMVSPFPLENAPMSAPLHAPLPKSHVYHHFQEVAERVALEVFAIRNHEDKPHAVRIFLRQEVFGGAEVQITLAQQRLEVLFLPQEIRIEGLLLQGRMWLEERLKARTPFGQVQVAVQLRSRRDGKTVAPEC